MSETVRNIGVVYGNIGEIFSAGGGTTLEEFVEQAFGIKNVFETKLVMGRCICHGKKDLETDILLSNRSDAEKFMFSKESTKPHIVLVYNKPVSWQNLKSQPEHQSSKDIIVSAEQWGDLVESVKKLQLSMESQPSIPDKPMGPVHEAVTCDSCYPETGGDSVTEPIIGSRFKCLDCVNFDLCSSCEAKGVEINSHRRYHNMVKINTPLGCSGRFNNAVGMGSGTSTDRQVILNVLENKKDIFEAISSVNAMHEVFSGYKAYCAQQAKIFHPPGRPKYRLETSLEITISRRDNLLTFNIYNNGRRSLPGGCTLFLSAESHYLDGYLGPHELRPGNRKLFHRQISYDIPKERVSIYIVTEEEDRHDILYMGHGLNLFDTCIKLKQPGSSRSCTPSTSSTLVSSAMTAVQDDDHCKPKPLSQANREDEGVMSSSTTNDEYSLCSETDNETNWEDYDFLSEDDL